MKRFLIAALAPMLFAPSVMAAEVYKVASDCTWPPMEMLDDNKQPAGYAVEYIKEVAKEAGIEVEVQNIAWDGIFGGVNTGKYDIVASSTTITPERQLQFDFSDPYYDVVQAVVLPAGESIASLADLKGKKVGGQIGTTGIFVMRKADVGADIREYDDVGLAIQDLVGGRIDAVICDDPVAMYYVHKKPDTAGKIDLSFKTDDTEQYGFTVRKGREDLVAKLNEGIRKVKESGKADELARKWMGE